MLAEHENQLLGGTNKTVFEPSIRLVSSFLTLCILLYNIALEVIIITKNR